MKEFLEKLAVAWCRARHNNPKTGRPNITLPQNGKYQCLTCLREYDSRTAIPEDLVWEA